jgi:hypothetical protein
MANEEGLRLSKSLFLGLGDRPTLSSSTNCILGDSFSSLSFLVVSSLVSLNCQTGASGILLAFDVALEPGLETQDTPLEAGLENDTALDLVDQASSTSSFPSSRLMTREKRLCRTTLPHLGSM